MRNLAGTYKVDGNRLTLKLRASGGDEEMGLTITRLTGTELVTKDGDGKEEKFNRSELAARIAAEEADTVVELACR